MTQYAKCEKCKHPMIGIMRPLLHPAPRAFCDACEDDLDYDMMA